MYKLLILFVSLYPFLILPLGNDPSNYFLPKSDYLTFFVLAMGSVLIWAVYKQGFRPKFKLAEWLLLGYIGLVTISTIQSVDILQSLAGVHRRYEGLWAWYAYISLFFFACYFINQKQYKWVLVAIVTGGWLCSIYGILQHFLLDFLPRHPSFIGYTRSFSFFDNPNYFGMYLVLVILVAVSLFMSEERKGITVVLFVVNLTLFAAMIYTFTRGAWAGMVVGLVGFAWMARDLVNWRRYIVLLTGFAFVLLLISTERGGHILRFLSFAGEPFRAIAGDEMAGSGRWYIWKNSLPLIPKYFWLGSGPDTFGIVFSGRNFLNAHNIFIHLAITMGFPAMLAYTAGITTVIIRGLTSVRKLTDGKDQLLLYGILAACIGYMVQNLFNVSVIVVAPFFWVLLGISYRLSSGESISNP